MSKGKWFVSMPHGRLRWSVGCVKPEEVGPFTRWFNYNPLSMELRWRFHLWATRKSGNRWESREAWGRCVRGGCCKTVRDALVGLVLQGRFGTWLAETWYGWVR